MASASSLLIVGLSAGSRLAGKGRVVGVRSSGSASGMRVVVDTVWKVWMTPVIVVVVSSEVVWMMVVLFSLSFSEISGSGCMGEVAGDGDCGASSKDSREVFASDGIAYAGGSQDGVRA
jgi:hypothetical protein